MVIPYNVFGHHAGIRNTAVAAKRILLLHLLLFYLAHSSPRRPDTHCHTFAAAVLPVYIPDRRSTGRFEWGSNEDRGTHGMRELLRSKHNLLEKKSDA